MTSVSHGTLTASASARACTAFFCYDKAVCNKNKKRGKGKRNQNPRNVFDKQKSNRHTITAPFKEKNQSLFLALVPGLTSIKRMRARARIAAVRPTGLGLPRKRLPNWLIMSATA